MKANLQELAKYEPVIESIYDLIIGKSSTIGEEFQISNVTVDLSKKLIDISFAQVADENGLTSDRIMAKLNAVKKEKGIPLRLEYFNPSGARIGAHGFSKIKYDAPVFSFYCDSAVENEKRQPNVVYGHMTIFFKSCKYIKGSFEVTKTETKKRKKK